MITAMREDSSDTGEDYSHGGYDYRDVRKDYGDRDPLTGKSIAACYQVHNELGPRNHRLSLRAKRSNLKVLYPPPRLPRHPVPRNDEREKRGLLVDFGNRRCEIRGA